MTVNYSEGLKNLVKYRTIENADMIGSVTDDEFCNEVASRCIEEVKMFDKDFYTFCIDIARSMSKDLKEAYEFNDVKSAEKFLNDKYGKKIKVVKEN